MHGANELESQLNEIFNPESVAIVGLPKGMKTGKLFLIAILEMGFSGPLYPVNPNYDEIDGLKTYPSVSAIPDPVDLAIVLVPHHSALDVVKECADKGVKGAVMFTAGYRETGTEEGQKLQDEMVAIAKRAGMRLFGPNCMGIYAPSSGLSFFPGLSKEPGPVGLISHSGSMTNIIGRLAPEKGLAFSKVVSLGNEADLNSADFLTYLGSDDETKVIGAYLEDIKDGPRFLKALKAASLNKPVILWKVGLTPEGGRAASSHTGALAGSSEIWQGVINQSGAIPVVGWEEWVDKLMGFNLLQEESGDRVAIISGPGGLCVSAAEACGNNGLKLADLADDTKKALAEFVPPTGTSLANPIDVGLHASLEIDIYINAARAAAADPGVDVVLVAGCGFDRATNEKYADELIKAKYEFKKPFLMVNIHGFDEDLGHRFCQSGLPFFETSERALNTYARVLKYQAWRRKWK